MTSKLPKATASDGKPTKKKGHKRHFSNYLLNKELQLRYIGFVTVLSIIITGSLGYLIWRHEDRASQLNVEQFDAWEKSIKGTDKRAEEERNEVRQLRTLAISGNEGRDRELILTMFGVGIGLIIVLSLYLLIMTHKVAGPLYKITMYFDKMRDGRLGDTWPLRKGDMLRDFYANFKEMHDAVRKRQQEDNAAVARFLEACEAAGVSREGELGHQLDELETYQKSREEALG